MKTLLAVLAFVALTATSHAGSSRHVVRATPSGRPSPVLTSVIQLEATYDPDVLILEATGLTATGERATVTEGRDCYREESYHLKAMTDPRDGYWDACYRIVLETGGRRYIAGYEEESGDSDEDDTDVSSSSSVNVPLEFDVKTQSFRIRTEEMLPLPVRFRQKSFAGLRFLVPVNLRGFTKQEVETLIRDRGGEVVGTAGPVDVLVLPDRVDFCANSYRATNRLAERWLRKGAKVLWERYLGKPNGPLPCDDAGEWRD